ncbi:MAG: nitrous oxide reductase family maturation protein NosD, partial [Phycisphaerae bacterium]
MRRACFIAGALLLAGTAGAQRAAATGPPRSPAESPLRHSTHAAPGNSRIVVTPHGPIELKAALAAARPGDTIEVAGGVHRGPFVVTAPIRLVGRDRPVLDGGGEGSVVEITVPGVTVTGFDIRGSGNTAYLEPSGVKATARVTVTNNRFDDVLYGINLKEAPGSRIAGNVIHGRAIHIARRGDGIRIWESPGTTVEGNEVVAVRDVVIWYSRDVVVRDNTVKDSRYGLHFMYSHASVVADNRFEGNSVGAFLMYSTDLDIEGNVFSRNHGPSGYGVGLKDSDRVNVLGNVFAGNRVGLYLDNTPSSLDVHDTVADNVFAYNDAGILVLPAVRRNSFRANRFIDNMTQVDVTGGGRVEGNDWTPGGAGNYWSNYAGFDYDGDGVGDLPFRLAPAFDRLTDRQPSLRLFSLGPVAAAVDIAGRAFPVFVRSAIVVDTAPVMNPGMPPIPAPPVDGRPLAAV